MPSGVGRPQGLINIELRKCDYFVLMLWDRWGSPTEEMPGSQFSSGTEEEYYEAIKCLDDDSLPMQRVVVLFKSVDPGKLGDPGKKLQPVLDFKQKLEAQHRVLYSTFDEVRRFEKHMRRHLARWVRDHESGGVEDDGVVTRPAPPTISEVAIEDPDSRSSDPDVDAFLARALELQRDGRITEAEATFAEALAVRESGPILRGYGQLLKRAGRLSDADRILRRGLEAPNENNMVRAQLVNELSLVADLRGKYREAVQLNREALKLLPGRTLLMRNLGTSLRRVGDYQEATRLLEKVVSRDTELFGADSPQASTSKLYLGMVAFDEGRFDEASELIVPAVETLRGHPSPRLWSRSDILSVVGDLHLAMNEIEEAEKLFNEAAEAIGEDPDLDFPADIGIKTGLADVALRRGDPQAAEAGFSNALQVVESFYGPEHIYVAGCLTGLGRAYAAQERYELAEQSFVRAWRWQSNELGPDHPKTMGTLLLLARLYVQQGQNDAALTYYESALPVLQRSLPDHPDTTQAESELDELRKLVAESSSEPEGDSTDSASTPSS